MADEIELAWAAGFFDGEGSIGSYIDKRDRSVIMRMSVGQTSNDENPPPSLQRFRRAVNGVGEIVHRDETSRQGGRPMWYWVAQALDDVRDSARLLLPYLTVKVDDVCLALAVRTEYEGLLADRRRFCHKGHEFSDENTYLQMDDAGKVRSRRCRTCNREYSRKYKARKRREAKANV